jgi:hypothetical protein
MNCIKDLQEQLQQQQQQEQQQQQCSQAVLDIDSVLGMVFELLEPRFLAVARCTCKLWRHVASDVQVSSTSNQQTIGYGTCTRHRTVPQTVCMLSQFKRLSTPPSWKHQSSMRAQQLNLHAGTSSDSNAQTAVDA